MKRNDFYPDNKSQQPEWHSHFATRLIVHGPALPLTTDEVDNAMADNLTLAYGLGNWITNVREYGPACTAQLEDLRRGTGNGTFAFLTCVAPVAPTLPVGADPVRPGALLRTFDLVAILKRKAGYTPAIGLDLGIIGPAAPPPPPDGEAPPPRITVTPIPGDTFQYARCKFIKDGHQNVEFQSRRGNGDWERLGLSNKSPLLASSPLLVSTQMLNAVLLVPLLVLMTRLSRDSSVLGGHVVSRPLAAALVVVVVAVVACVALLVI